MAGSRNPKPLNCSGIFLGRGTRALTRPCDPFLASAQIPKLPGYSRILSFPETLSGPACFLVMPNHSELRYLTFWLVLGGLVSILCSVDSGWELLGRVGALGMKLSPLGSREIACGEARAGPVKPGPRPPCLALCPSLGQAGARSVHRSQTQIRPYNPCL